MKKRLVELACRRRRLLEEIECERIEMAKISRQLQEPLALIDAGLKVVRYINGHRAWLAGSVAMLLAFRRKGLAGLAQQGWRLLIIYPSILSCGLKYLSSATCAAKQGRNAEADHCRSE